MWLQAFLVRVARLELTTPWPPVKCATNCATPGFQFAALEVSLVIITRLAVKCNTFFHYFQFFLVRNFGISVDKPPEDMLLYQKCSRGGQPPVMERCPSGWRNRSWKPATRKCPWVRIPLSPPLFLISYDLQKYPRGRRGSPAKGVGWIKPARGFKSLLLRHKVATIRIF